MLHFLWFAKPLNGDLPKDNPAQIGSGGSSHSRHGGYCWLGRRAIDSFNESIVTRSRWVVGSAFLGLIIVALTALVASLGQSKVLEDSLAEARLEIIPAYHLETHLRELEVAAYRHAIEGLEVASLHAENLAEHLVAQFQLLDEGMKQFEGIEHNHSHDWVAGATEQWRTAEIGIRRVFEQRAGTQEAATSLNRAHTLIVPIYQGISDFISLAMLDMKGRVQAAHSFTRWTFFGMFAFIFAGGGALVAIGRMARHTILEPIEELCTAAHRLGQQDFSYRVHLRNNRDELGQLGKAFNIAAASIQRLYRELEDLSTHDGLTGALNRTAFDRRLSDECEKADRHGRPLSLLVLDIDWFKRVNDAYGHQAGDHVLKSVVQLAEDTTRTGDVVARYGGEEFAIILPECAMDEAKAMAERIRRKIENTVVNYNESTGIKVTISVGCACRLPRSLSAKELVRAADDVLYEAKKTGRNRVMSAPKCEKAAHVKRQGAYPRRANS